MRNSTRSSDRGLLRHRNEPGRFFGDGVSFKAKLIGILEVGEARGDRMCQEALQDLKMAIRAAGEHKQRITIHVTIDGLRLRDEKTGDSLYHHPVHKISFIAQDMTDSRAFGYIFGSPDSGHRFFGIKTDKAASQVVLAMRDLFQVVFELKKKEIELARQHIQSKITAHEHQAVSASLVAKSGGSTLDSSGGGGGAGGSSSSYGKNHSSETALGALAAGGSSMGAGSSGAMKMVAGKSEKSPESVADLVDLEQELSCIQRGITQMERITPSEGPGKSVLDDDPFGDSFANIPPSYNLLPPPESSKRHQKQTHRSTENLPTMESSPNVSSTPPPMPAPPIPTQPSAGAAAGGGATTLTGSSSSQPAGGTSSNNNNNTSNNPPPSQGDAGGSTLTSSNSVQNDDWLNSPPNTSRFDPEPARYSDEPKNPEDTGKTPQPSAAAQPSSYTDVFTDLDPLGTGKIKPYIDKKFFFQELKNPPKKVLKDLSGKESTFNANFASEDGLLQQSVGGSASLNASNISTLASGSGDLFKASFDEAQSSLKNANSSAEAGLSGAGDGGGQAGGGAGTGMPLIESLVGGGSSAPADPFMEDDDFSKLQLDPFEVHFSRNASPRNAGGQQEGGRPSDSEEPSNNKPPTEAKDGTVYNGPLQVNLPPESWASYISQKRLERQTSEASAAAQTGQTGGPNAHRNRPAASSVFKQNTVDVISSLSSSSKKMKPNLFGQKFSKRDSNSINMRRLQESDSLSETEMAPEPPPRPDSGSHIEPPPLPPKKQFADIVIRPSPRSSSSSSSHAGGAGSGSLSGHGPRERYDYVGSKYDSSRPPSGGDRAGSDAPPLPLPSRKVGRTAGETVGPGRPQKKCTDEDDYLAPIGKIDIPTLLPPPQRKDASKTTRTTRKQSETDPRNLDEPTPPPSSKSPTGSGAGHFAKELDQHHHQQQQQQSVTASSFLPDITLSQLLTLGIDELAAKLNVPVSKLSTMTLVELTTYLSEFIENSKYPTAPAPAPPPSAAPSWATSSSISQDNTAGRDGSVSESPVFKVNFDDSNDAMFVAKFDDNFGEDERPARGPDRTSTFVANFDHLNLQPTGGSGSHPSSAPVVDKYAVFREIIEQEIGTEGAGSVDAAPEQDQEQRTGPNDRSDSLDLQKEVASEMNRLSPAFIGGETANVGSSPLPMHSFGGSSASPLTTGPPLTKIDTKITEVISQAKDRYAALRDIILVEDLFEKPAAPMARMESSSFEDRELDDDAKFEANFDDMEPAVVQQQQQENTSPEINISDADINEDEMQHQQRQLETGQDGGAVFRGAVTPREDLEIDELMQKAVSNLSLHSNEQLSPAPTGSASTQLGQGLKGSPLLQHSATSPYRPTNMSTSTTLLNDMIGPKAKSPTTGSTMVQYETLSLGPSGRSGGGGLSDMSTSPIPPLGPKSSSSSGTGMAKSPILKPSPMSRRSDEGGRGKPTPAPRGQSSSDKRSSGSMSDGDGESSPEGDNNEEGKLSRMTPTNANESWAVFDQPEPPLHHPSKRQDMRPDTVRGDSGRRSGDKNGPDSPCSSDPKDEWTKADLRDYNRRWPSKGHTSSSSRDVSPWDEEGPDYRKRSSMHPSGGGGDPSMRHHHPTSGERYHHPRMPPRRINSNDEDYDEELVKERGQQRRRMKSGVGSRSRDNFEDEHWYHDHHAGPTWSSPTEDEDVRGPPGERGERGSRSFDRNAYERSTYGPPYEKREPKSLPPAYDRREYGKGYDKRKYYREREPSRGGSGGRYDYDPYGGDGGYGGRRGADYDEGVVYERPSRDSRAAREYFYERERKSFDRESNESYDSRERQRSFGSGDIYGSLDSRAEYRERDRYLSLDKSRSLRRGMRNAGSARLDQELDQDSEGDLIGGMMGGSGRSGGGLRDAGGNSLHRSSQNIGRGGGGGGSKQQQQQQMMMMLDDDVWGVTKGGGGVGSAATMPWKRPSSATEQQEQRRYNEAGGRSGRGMGPVVGGTSLAGSDGEKDRRFRKKSRSRADRKEMEMRTNYATMRYPVRSKEDYFDFDAPEGGRVGAGVDDDDDEDDEDEVPAGKLTLLDDPLDEGPAYYGPGRRVPPGGPLPPGVGGAYYGKSSTPRQEGRSLNDALIAQEAKKMARYEYEEEALRRMKKSNSRDLYFEGGSGGGGGGGSGYGSVTPPKSAAQKQHSVAPAGRTPLDFEFEEYADPAGPPAGGDGFESDFNSPPTGGTGGGGPGGAGGRSDVPKSYRFSSDFSNEKERAHYAHDPPPSGGYHRPQQHYKAHASSGAGYADTGDYPQQAPASSSATPPPGHHHQHHQHHREQTAAVGSGSKLRFNENVTVSKFDAEATTMFEDDFAGRSDAEQDPDDGQQQQQQGWSAARITTSPGPAAAPATSNNGSNKKILKTSSQAGHHQQQHQQHQQQQLFNQDNIRKSDSINIFAKKVDDPFEDDDFFASSGGGGRGDPFGGSGAGNGADAAHHGGGATATGAGGWDKNFANFDDNI
ncbi:AGAP006528-PA [Anopheles gambiae str. PEST]|uniref:AGAP006528-PA n=1 Tax=Anopheles gambiae TaxID=7165 RepID=Q7Q5B6_ANOGA|nr:AGAP006528-PA [Anopheles gambiae str. PEST]